MKTFIQILEGENGYFKVGGSNKYDDTPKVVEVVSGKDSANKARTSHAAKYKNVFVQPASKKDFADFSNGKSVKWEGK
jgi:hypothetical protein